MFRKAPTSITPMSNETSTDTSKKFQSAKSISSDQYFGRDNNMDVGLDSTLFSQSDNLTLKH